MTTGFRFSRHFEQVELIYRGADDGHTVEGIIVPYDAPVDVDDEHGRYREVWTSTSFAGWLPRLHRARAEHRIGLNLDHSEALDNRIGFARQIVDTAEGLRAVFRLYSDPHRLDKIRDMLATSHRGLSIEGYVSRHRDRGGAREWLGATVSGVAATPKPVHPGARILAIRAEDDDTLGPPETPRLDAAMARWGIGALPSHSDA